MYTHTKLQVYVYVRRHECIYLRYERRNFEIIEDNEVLCIYGVHVQYIFICMIVMYVCMYVVGHHSGAVRADAGAAAH